MTYEARAHMWVAGRGNEEAFVAITLPLGESMEIMSTEDARAFHAKVRHAYEKAEEHNRGRK